MQAGNFTIQQFEISGPLLISPKIFGDERGFFTERFRAHEFKQIQLPEFIQENFSRSQKNVLRGLHLQYNKPQGKLVTATRGKIFDVAVDVRKDSGTYGKHVAVTLDGDRPQWFYVPVGFAHGFYVLSDEGADVLYKTTCYYNPKGEAAILWNDPELNIAWPSQNPVLSEKDRVSPIFADYKKQPLF